jgi:hypothetical protein
MWLTHPLHGITYSMPVIVERAKRSRPSASWVQWREAA